MRLPPAGCTSMSQRRSPSPTPRPRSSKRAHLRPTGRRRGSPTRPRSVPMAYRRTIPATADTREPGARARRLTSSDRGGRPRGATGRVSVAPSSDCGVASSSPRSHGPRLRSSRPSAFSVELLLEPRGRLGAVQGDALLRDDRSGVEARVHPHERHARLGVTSQDRGRDRRRPSMAWQQRGMEIEGAVPDPEQLRRDDLAVVGEHEELGLEREDLGDRLRGRAGARASGSS